jgi:hypothetical protein
MLVRSRQFLPIRPGTVATSTNPSKPGSQDLACRCPSHAGQAEWLDFHGAGDDGRLQVLVNERKATS